MTVQDFVPDRIETIRAQIVSGNYISLGSKDGSSLVVNSIASAGYHFIDWYAEYTLPSIPVTSLSIAYTGKYSTWRGQSLLLYNFSANKWQSVDYRVVAASIVSFELASIASPNNYVSADGKLRLRVYSFSLAGFTTYTDYLKVGATFSEALTGTLEFVGESGLEVSIDGQVGVTPLTKELTPGAHQVTITTSILIEGGQTTRLTVIKETGE